MSTNCESKVEYDFIYNELLVFLKRNETLSVLGQDCINGVRSLLLNRKTKERKLAGYMRNLIKNSKDAKTTSPVEGHNRQVKKGPSSVNNNMHLDKMLERFISGITNRYRRRHTAANRELAMKNQASQAPTSPYLIRKGQGLIDKNYDVQTELKYARVGSNTFWVWDFEPKFDPAIVHQVMHYLPKSCGFGNYRFTKTHRVNGL